MRKLTLDVDTLRVDSFEAIRPEAGAGTVQAHGRGADGDGDAGEMAARFGTYYINCFYTQQASCTC